MPKSRPTYRVLYDCPEFQYTFYSGPDNDKAVEALRVAQILATGNRQDWTAFLMEQKHADVDMVIRMSNIVTKVQDTFATGELAGPRGFTGWLHFSTGNELGYVRFQNGLALKPNCLHGAPQAEEAGQGR